MSAANQILQNGRYRILQMLKEDETGTAYQAYDGERAASVVIKELSPAHAEAFGDVRHPALAGDVFSENGRRYLLEETPPGETAAQRLERTKRPFETGEALKWADDLLDALHRLHTQQPPVIHGEITPQNLIVTPEGAIKLAGLRQASPLNTGTGAFASAATASPYTPLERIWSSLDATSQKVILKNYDERSEEILEQPPDERADLYSLAALLYQMLTARPPVDPLERSIDILDGKPDPLAAPHTVNPNVPPEISDVLTKALEIRREHRFSSAVIMRQILRTAAVRVKERKALEAKKQQDAARQSELAEQRRQEKERAEQESAAQQKRLAAEAEEKQRIEEEEKRQTELIRQQLREAESRRLAAERRAAEAERRLIEIELEKAADDVPAPADEKTFAEPPAAAPPAVVLQEQAPAPVSDHAPAELLSSYAEQPISGNFRRMAVAAVALIAVGGAAWGLSGFVGAPAQSAAPPAVLQQQAPPAPGPAANETISAPESAERQPTIETNAEPAETPATEIAESEDAASPDRTRTLPASAPRRARKQTTVARQPAEKKSVTVDDIINDN